MVSINDKILLYLEEHADEQFHFAIEKPEHIAIFSRDGVAEAVGILPTQVSRAMKSFERDGVTERKRYYIGETGRFRNFYFLTDAGIYHAKKIKEAVGDTIVFVFVRGEKKKVKISEINEWLRKNSLVKQFVKPINYSAILKHTSNSIFDWEMAMGIKKYVDFADKRPEIKYFFGREEELKDFLMFMKSSAKILTIRGIAGIGKTTLVSKIAEDYKGRTSVFWHRVTNFTTISSLLVRLADFLEQQNKPQLKRYLTAKKKMELEDVLPHLEYIEGLLVFDDFQKVNKELIEFFSLFKESIEKAKNLKVVTIGRTIPPFYNRYDVEAKKLVVETALQGLDSASSKRLLSKRRINDAMHDKLYNLTMGHPLLLELITPETRAEAEEYIKEEILEKLDNDEKRFLELASVFRFPFYPRAIRAGDVHYDTIDALVKKSLLQRSGNVYDEHDVLREFFYGRLSGKQKIDYHRIAAEYYKKEEGEQAAIEAMYHFICANLKEKAVEMAVSIGENLIRKGYFKELMTVLRELDQKTVKKINWLKILMLKGDISNLVGNLDDSLQYYHQALTLSKVTGDATKTVEAYRKIGCVAEARGEWDGALDYFEKSLKLSKKLGIICGIAEAYCGLGKIYLRKSKYAQAIKCLQNGIKYAKQSGIDSVAASANIDLGRCYTDKGHWDKAIEFYTEGLKLLEHLENTPELVRGYNNLGTVYGKREELYGKKEDMDKAIECYEKCVELSEKIGFVRGIAYGLMNVGNMYTRASDFGKAMDYCDKALQMFRKLGDKFGISMVYDNYGIIYQFKKDWGNSIKCFNESISILKTLNVPYRLGYVYHDFGLMYRYKGDKKGARAYLQKALRIFERIEANEDAERERKAIAELTKIS